MGNTVIHPLASASSFPGYEGTEQTDPAAFTAASSANPNEAHNRQPMNREILAHQALLLQGLGSIRVRNNTGGDLNPATSPLVRISGLAGIVEEGDTATQLSSWGIYGATMRNTASGRLYWTLTNTSTTRTVQVYSRKNHDTVANDYFSEANLVASGSRTGDGAITLTEQNSSGITGVVTVAYTADDTDQANILHIYVADIVVATSATDNTFAQFVLRETIADGALGYVYTHNIQTALNTSGYSAAGARVYLGVDGVTSVTAGTFSQNVGICLVKDATNGVLLLALGGVPAGTLPSHAPSHKSAGGDPIKLDELATPTDVTTLNATTALHGLLPKLSGSPQQYLGGDGAWYDVPLAANLFLATAASDIGGYKSLTQSVPAGGETSVSASIPGNDTEIEQWAATAVDTPRFINEQILHAHLHINQSAGTKGSTLYAKMFHRTSGGVETLIGTSNTVVVPAVKGDFELSVSVADTSFAATDRLVIKVYASPTGAGTDPTVAVYFEGTTYARIEADAAAVAPTAHAASHASGGSDAIKLDDLAAPDDNTDLNASTTAHGLAPKATAPSAGLLSVLGIANAETARTDKALFDVTLPAAVGTAAVGTAMVAARRDHVHDALPFVAVDGTLPTGANADVVASKLVYNKTCSDSDGDDIIDLHDGTIIGQIVTIHLGTKSGSDNAVITPVTKLGYSTITLDAVAELATLQWQGAVVGWAILYASGTVA